MPVTISREYHGAVERPHRHEARIHEEKDKQEIRVGASKGRPRESQVRDAIRCDADNWHHAEQLGDQQNCNEQDMRKTAYRDDTRERRLSLGRTARWKQLSSRLESQLRMLHSNVSS